MRRVLLTMIVVLLIATPIVSAQGDPALAALDYVKSQKNDDGSYGEGIVDTILSNIALSLLDEPDADALTWITDYYAENKDDVTIYDASLMVLSIAAAGEDAKTFADGAIFASLNSRLARDRGQDVEGLCLGLIALNATGTSVPSLVTSALLDRQNEDGGFGKEAGDDSEPAVTASCIHALALTENEEAINAAIDYLTETQNEDGGWPFENAGDSSTLLTAYVLTGLNAVGADLMVEWAPAVGFMMQNVTEDGAFGEELPVSATALGALVFRGLSLNSILETEEIEGDDEEADGEDSEEDETAAGEAPTLDAAQWAPIAEGFMMEELDTADDFLVTVVDPFTDEELYGIEIINWVAEYQYTGYIIEDFLPADVLLWLAEQEPDTWENISPAVVTLLPDDEVSKLPEDVQALAEE
ncbi:MAG: hypothetical protein L0154_12745 [Chloroflexi bacterium]|nr:hypothetical protein [Chloroflexota bacterium]